MFLKEIYEKFNFGKKSADEQIIKKFTTYVYINHSKRDTGLGPRERTLQYIYNYIHIQSNLAYPHTLKMEWSSCPDPESFVRGGSTLTEFYLFVLVDEGREDPNTTISWPSSACQRNAIKMAFRTHTNDGPTSNAGLVCLGFFRVSGPELLRNPPPCPSPSGSTHGLLILFKKTYQLLFLYQISCRNLFTSIKS